MWHVFKMNFTKNSIMKRKLLAIVLLAAATGAFAQKPLLLNLKKGETYLQKTSVDLKMNQQFGGMDMEVSITNVQDLNFKVVDVKDSLFFFEIAYTKLKMAVNAQGMNMEYSSDVNKDKASAILASMVSKPFRATISNRGIVHKIEADSLIKAVVNASGNPNDPETAAMSAQIKNSFGEASLKDNIASSLAMFTPARVSKGSKWETKRQLSGQMPLISDIKFEVIDETPTTYSIKMNSVVSSPLDAPAISNAGMEMKYSVNGSVEGTIILDKSTGWIINNTSEQALKGVMDILPGAQMPNGAQIPITIVANTVISNK